MTAPEPFVSEDQFIDQLAAEVRRGLRLVPLLGSGCSSHSGILMGQQFSDYLAWTVYRCVAEQPREDGAGDHSAANVGPRWDLRAKGWPPPPGEGDLKRARRWVFEAFRKLGQNLDLDLNLDERTHRVRGLRLRDSPGILESFLTLSQVPAVPQFLRHPESAAREFIDSHGLRRFHALIGDKSAAHGGLMLPGISPTSDEAIQERAIRALHDWRATLQFLSEHRLAEDGQKLLRSERDQAVIDGFNVHITRGRRPNLTHTMLAHLREPARMRLVLTTNFDTLIEDAFAQQHRDVSVISVSIRGELPDPDIVHARDTVVKLHGTLTETRADFSLDDPPTQNDCARFFHYVRGGPPGKTVRRFMPGQLLVAGYSGSDARCVELIKFVLEDPDARVFWVCNSSRDQAHLDKTFTEPAYRRRIVATVSERVDLLLLEFHQRLCLSLPPGGFNYQMNHNVPPGFDPRPRNAPGSGPSDWRDSGERAAALLVSEANKRLVPSPGSADGKASRPLIVVDGPSGVLGALRNAYSILSRTHSLSTVWLELEDYSSTAATAHEIFQVIAVRQGIFQLGHAQLCPESLCRPLGAGSPADATNEFQARVRDWKSHIRFLSYHLGIQPNQWMIVLYGRNGPGGCCGWEENRFWDDDGSDREYGRPPSPGATSQPSTLLAFLSALTQEGYMVLYAPYSERRRKDDEHRKAVLTNVLNHWAGDLDPDAPERIRKVIEDNFKLPERTHSTDNMGFWLAASNAVLATVDLTDALAPADDEMTRYRTTLQGILNVLEQTNYSGTASDRFMTARRRYNLLHGSSLFRQSRHFTAFLTEGLLACPERFNEHGIDNDLLRSAQLDAELRKLRWNPRIFHRKSGGLAWMYHDVRMALRCITEVTSQVVAATSARRTSEDRLLPCAALCSRTHFWIGEWYVRAFYVSGHAGALMEAAHHFFKCATSAPSADRLDLDAKDRPAYRFVWWRGGMNQLLKVLRLGGTLLRFWFGREQTKTWFEDGVSDKLKRDVQASYEAIKPESSSERNVAEELIALLRVELKQLERRNGPKRLLRTQSYHSLQGVRATADNDDVDAIPEIDPAILRDPGPYWWRKAADTYAGSAVRTLLEETQAFVEKGEDKAHTPISRTLARVELEKFTSAPPEAAARVQQFVEWTFLLLSRAKREEHGTVRLVGDKDSSEYGVESVPAPYRTLLTPARICRLWVRVCVFAQGAIAAGYALPPGLDLFGNTHTAKALAMYGLALARLHRFNEAHRRLNHAHALLRDAGRAAPLVAVGVLDMRRAEAYLLESRLAAELASALTPLDRAAVALLHPDAAAEAVPAAFSHRLDAIQQGANPLPEQRKRGILMWLQSQLKYFAVPIKELDGGKMNDGLRKIAMARCDDAWGCLERAEALLGGRTHSPLWWSRLRALQLRAFAGPYPFGSNAGTGTYRPLTDRIRHDLPTTLFRLWSDGRTAAPDDMHNRISVLDYYVRSLAALDLVQQFRNTSHVSPMDDLTLEMIKVEYAQLRGMLKSDPQPLALGHLANVAFRLRSAGFNPEPWQTSQTSDAGWDGGPDVANAGKGDGGPVPAGQGAALARASWRDQEPLADGALNEGVSPSGTERPESGQ